MAYWTGKSVAITGGGSGIGLQLGKALAGLGAQIWLSDVNEDALHQAVAAIPQTIATSVVDVTNAGAVRAHIEGIHQHHGRIDAVFNNAGIGLGGDISELNLEHFRQSMDVNVMGVVHGILAAFPLMKAQGGGILVNTASAAGLLGLPLMAPYSMSKHAVVGLSRSLRIEAAEHNIQMNVLCPTAIETPLLETDLARELGASWRPDIRSYLTDVGGAPYPVEQFVDYALHQIERNKAVIVAPAGARVRLILSRLFPGLVDILGKRAFLKAIESRDL